MKLSAPNTEKAAQSSGFLCLSMLPLSRNAVSRSKIAAVARLNVTVCFVVAVQKPLTSQQNAPFVNIAILNSDFVKA